jgi:hypothetical protein
MKEGKAANPLHSWDTKSLFGTASLTKNNQQTV